LNPLDRKFCLTAVPPLAKTFDLKPFLGIWVPWSRIRPCFRPGPGRRAAKIDPELAPVRQLAGIYILRCAEKPAMAVSHTDPAVVYIGETSHFGSRMNNWAASAGFWGERKHGHSAAYRWDDGHEHLSVGFFETPTSDKIRLGKHIRLYYEVLATEEYRVAHGRLPRVNEHEKVSAV